MSGILTNFTTKRWYDREVALAKKVGRMAKESKSIEVGRDEDLVVRGILPSEDLNSGGENGWTDGTGSGVFEWRQDFNSSGTDDAYNEAYEVDSSSLAEDKIIGFMGLSVLHSDMQTRQVRFSGGVSGNQGVREEINIEALETGEEGRAMFLTDIIFGAKEHGSIEFYEDLANDDNRVVFHGYVAEAVGETLAEATNPFLAQGSTGNPAARGR